MRFPTLSGLWRSRSDRRPARGRPAGARLAVEALEDRAVPANFTAADVPELIAAIDAANQTPEADTIALVAGTTYSLTAVNNFTHGRTGLPVIAAGENLTIIGSNDIIERSTVAGTPSFRLFDVAVGATLTLVDLTLQGGLASGSNTNDLRSQGGAIYNQGSLTLDGVIVQNNTAQGGAAGGAGLGGFAGATRGMGGGVFSVGALTVIDSTFLNNAAIGGRGTTIETAPPPVTQSGGGSFIRSWPGADGLGGGIYIGGGTATITGSSLTSNTAQGGEGAKGEKKGKGIGGGIYIAPESTTWIDEFTVSHTRRNTSSNADNNIAGSYIPV